MTFEVDSYLLSFSQIGIHQTIISHGLSRGPDNSIPHSQPGLICMDLYKIWIELLDIHVQIRQRHQHDKTNHSLAPHDSLWNNDQRVAPAFWFRALLGQDVEQAGRSQHQAGWTEQEPLVQGSGQEAEPVEGEHEEDEEGGGDGGQAGGHEQRVAEPLVQAEGELEQGEQGGGGHDGQSAGWLGRFLAEAHVSESERTAAFVQKISFFEKCQNPSFYRNMNRPLKLSWNRWFNYKDLIS